MRLAAVRVGALDQAHGVRHELPSGDGDGNGVQRERGPLQVEFGAVAANEPYPESLLLFQNDVAQVDRQIEGLRSAGIPIEAHLYVGVEQISFLSYRIGDAQPKDRFVAVLRWGECQLQAHAGHAGARRHRLAHQMKGDEGIYFQILLLASRIPG